jgi:hypothetical protein
MITVTRSRCGGVEEAPRRHDGQLRFGRVSDTLSDRTGA